jgi:hypothetical protein
MAAFKPVDAVEKTAFVVGVRTCVTAPLLSRLVLVRFAVRFRENLDVASFA